MKFTQENVKYCLLSFDAWQQGYYEQFFEKEPAITGLFQWAKALGGTMDFPRTPDNFSKYNLIHVNLTPRNLTQLYRIAPMIDRNHTKLIVNVDYTIDLWVNNYIPEQFLAALDMADYVFGVEEMQADLLAHALKRPVACIPHPADIDGIGKLATTERKPIYGAFIHRYDKNFMLPWFALQNLDRNKWMTMAMTGGCVPGGDVACFYDMYQGHLGFPDMCKAMAEMYCLIDTYTIRSYGRFSIDAAALGVPCIGPNCVNSIVRCFPDLTTEINDMPAQSKLVDRLAEDEDFYRHVSEYAQRQVEYYGYQNCRTLMFDFLNSPQ